MRRVRTGPWGYGGPAPTPEAIDLAKRSPLTVAGAERMIQNAALLGISPDEAVDLAMRFLLTPILAFARGTRGTPTPDQLERWTTRAEEEADPFVVGWVHETHGPRPHWHPVGGGRPVFRRPSAPPRVR